MFRIGRGLLGLVGLDWLIVQRLVCRLLVLLALNNHDRHPIAEFLLNRSFDWPWWCCEMVQDVEMIKVVKVVASFLPSVSKFRVENRRGKARANGTSEMRSSCVSSCKLAGRNTAWWFGDSKIQDEGFDG